MPNVHIDFETRSRVDLKTAGVSLYARHSSTSILCLSYAIDKSEVRLMTKPQCGPDEQMGSREQVLRHMASNEEFIFYAHNAAFEQAIWSEIMVKRHGYPPIPLKRWRCTMAMCAALALPMDLKGAGKAVRALHLKNDEGSRTMLKLAKPRRETLRDKSEWHEKPEDLKKLYDYNVQDVLAERSLHESIRDLIPQELEIWFLDQKINQRGIQIDIRYAHKALNIIKECSDRLTDEFRDITNGFCSPSQLEPFGKWLRAQGVTIPDLKAETVAHFLTQPLPPYVKRTLEIRQQLSKASVKKYRAMIEGSDQSGRCRDLLQYHAASTGRWGGRRIQPQNFPRGTVKAATATKAIELYGDNYDMFEFLYSDVMGAVSAGIRGSIIAKDGHVLYVADYAQIEARVVAWIANDESLLSLFASNSKIYEYMAGRIFDVPPETIGKNSVERHLGKSAVLGCGYQMGGERFATQYGVDRELADACVSGYRSSFPSVRQFWYDIENTAVDAVLSGRRQHLAAGRLTFFVHENFLYCKLPSGRCIAYHRPSVKWVTRVFQECLECHKQHISETASICPNCQSNLLEEKRIRKKTLFFWGVDSITKQYRETTTYGGMLTENVVQAISRDLMADAMLRWEKTGYSVVLSVHDEGVAETPEDFGSLEEFIQIMEVLPHWAEGIPVKAEGYRDKRYRK